MPVTLGSAHGYIKLDASGVKRGVEEAKKEIGGLSQRFIQAGQDIGQAASMIAKGAGFIGAQLQVLKTAFAFGKEINQIEFMRSKFDNLARSVGTTSQALLGELRKATRGLIADSQLAASATDFMTLGLAKNHDEVVRLTRAAGALGMNMNQLVLTLTNMTTMRFDALGLSVDGFDDKVKALERSGLSAADAFKEAFLQQAETQIATVGDVADAGVASSMRLEAATTNLSDELKRSLAPAFADAAEGAWILLTYNKQLKEAFNEHRETVTRTAKSYDEYVLELIRAASAAGQFEGNQKRIARAILEGQLHGDSYTRRVRELAIALGLLSEQEFTYQRAVEAGTIKVQQYASASQQAGSAVQLSAAQLNELERSASGSARELDGLIRKQGELKSAMDSWMSDTAGQVVEMLGRRFGEASSAYRSALAEVDAVLGSNYTKQMEQKDAVQKLVAEYAKTQNLDAFREGLQRIREEGLADMKSELENTTKKAGELYEKLLGLPEEIKVKIKFDVEGYPDWLPQAAARNRVERSQAENFRDTGSTPTPRAIGGAVWKNKAYRWQEGLGGEVLISERSGHILNQRQVEKLLQNRESGDLAEMAAAVRALAERATNVQVNGIVRDERDVEALAWRTARIVIQQMGG